MTRTGRSFDISHSDIASFLQCRRQFWFNYVLGFSDARFPVGAAPAGVRVHEALEGHYDPAGPRDPRQLFEELAQRDIARASSTGQPPWVCDKLYEDVLLGRRMVADYVTWLEENQPDAQWDPVCTEAKLRYTLEFDDPVWEQLDSPHAVAQRTSQLRQQGFTAIRLQGKVDLVQQHTSPDPSDPRYAQIRMTDWKTTGRTFQVDEGFQRSNQSYFYDMLLEMAQDLPAPLQEARARAISTNSPPAEFNYRIIQRPRSRNAPTEVRDLPITHSQALRRSRRRQIFSVVAELIDATLQLDPVTPPSADVTPLTAQPSTVHLAERYAFPSPSDACGWCDFRTPCDVTDDGPDVAIAMISTSPNYISGQRHQRYAETSVPAPA
jgi:hypothetical protein